MNNNYYSNGKIVGYTHSDSFGNKSLYSNKTGKKIGSWSTTAFGTPRFVGTDGKTRCTYGKDIWGNNCRFSADGKKQGTYGKDAWGNDCFTKSNGKKIIKTKSWW